MNIVPNEVVNKRIIIKNLAITPLTETMNYPTNEITLPDNRGSNNDKAYQFHRNSCIFNNEEANDKMDQTTFCISTYARDLKLLLLKTTVPHYQQHSIYSAKFGASSYVFITSYDDDDDNVLDCENVL